MSNYNNEWYGIVLGDGYVREYNTNSEFQYENGALVKMRLLNSSDAIIKFSTVNNMQLEWSQGSFLCRMGIVKVVNEELFNILIAIRQYYVRSLIVSNPDFIKFLLNIDIGKVVVVNGYYFNRKDREIPCIVKYIGSLPEVGPGTYFGCELYDPRDSFIERNEYTFKYLNCNPHRGFIKNASYFFTKTSLVSQQASDLLQNIDPTIYHLKESGANRHTNSNLYNYEMSQAKTTTLDNTNSFNCNFDNRLTERVTPESKYNAYHNTTSFKEPSSYLSVNRTSRELPSLLQSTRYDSLTDRRENKVDNIQYFDDESFSRNQMQHEVPRERFMWRTSGQIEDNNAMLKVNREIPWQNSNRDGLNLQNERLKRRVRAEPNSRRHQEQRWGSKTRDNSIPRSFRSGTSGNDFADERQKESPQKRLSGAGNKRLKWLIQHGYSKEEARIMAAQKIGPDQIAKNDFSDGSSPRFDGSRKRLRSQEMEYRKVSKYSADSSTRARVPGESRKLSGAGRKRYQWLIKHGHSEKEARLLAANTIVRRNRATQRGRVNSSSRVKSPTHNAIESTTRKKEISSANQLSSRDNDSKTKSTSGSNSLNKQEGVLDSNAPIKGTLNSINVAIFHITFPQAFLTQEQCSSIQEAILEEILEHGEGSKPRFLGNKFKSGYLLLQCADKPTQQWIKEIVPNLKPWKEACLQAMEESELLSWQILTGNLPNSSDDSNERILSLLGRQNKALDVSKWRILKTVKDTDSLVVTFAVDIPSQELLKTLNYTVCFKFGEVTLCPINEGEETRSLLAKSEFTDPLKSCTTALKEQIQETSKTSIVAVVCKTELGKDAK